MGSATNSKKKKRRKEEKKRRRGEEEKRKRKRKSNRKYGGEDLSQWDPTSNSYPLNRKGIQICQRFNKRQCGMGRQSLDVPTIVATSATYACAHT